MVDIIYSVYGKTVDRSLTPEKILEEKKEKINKSEAGIRFHIRQKSPQ